MLILFSQVVGKPPLPPNRMASRQDSAVSSSETETETETEKSESEQSEKEKAAKPVQPTVQQKTGKLCIESLLLLSVILCLPNSKIAQSENL